MPEINIYTENHSRTNIKLNGIVQGVGFRPFVYNLAQKYKLTGFVKNNSYGVEIEVEGDDSLINKFIHELQTGSPPLSEIKKIGITKIDPKLSELFEILSSEESINNNTLISPDICICEDCIRELFDPANRRYLYPFINCTNCGPRYTIIENIPYDRKNTTMNKFQMCGDCRKEYDDPANRRFHAQPNACKVCGPKVWFESENFHTEENWLVNSVDHLVKGLILAIKGLGGFHLAVDATNQSAVDRLRLRKGREAKPLAIMVPSLECAKQIVELNSEEEKQLCSPQRPILLLRKNLNNKISESIAPGNNRLGIMLPYTPLHYIILKTLQEKLPEDKLPILVMTSGNYSEEPIAITNDDARERLGNIADGFLMHNRDILIRSDDSVAVHIKNKTRIIRRSRSYVPLPIQLNKKLNPVLAVGGELKNTICLLKEDNAFLSQHIGDLTNYSAYTFFQESIEHLQKILNYKAEVIAHDLHPDYQSTKWAKMQQPKKYPVQHHHAHLASCMAEHSLENPVIGIILDGTGYGYDRTIWGGEILIGDFISFKRFAHLEQIPLPGGDAAAREPWRIAIAYLHHASNGKMPDLIHLNNFDTAFILQMIKKKFNSPLTSSMGRLFDAVAAMAGGPQKIGYEAEAAIHLMHAIDESVETLYDCEFNKNTFNKIIPLKVLIQNIYKDVLNGTAYSTIAARFHNTLVNLFTEILPLAREKYSINEVVLSGGVFQNEFLLGHMENSLNEVGFNVYTHSQIPTNDGGLSLGQAAIVDRLIKNNLEQPIYEL